MPEAQRNYLEGKNFSKPLPISTLFVYNHSIVWKGGITLKVPSKKRRILPVVLAFVLVMIMAALGGAAWLLSGLSLEIQINGDKEICLQYGETYTDQGAVALLNSPILGEFILDIPVKTGDAAQIKAPGTYPITYEAGIWWLQTAVQRTVTVVDQELPVITLISVPGSYTLPGQAYTEEGYVATDNCDGDITDKVQRTVTDAEVIYTVADSSGNTTEVHRTIFYNDPEAPVLTLTGGEQTVVIFGSAYAEPGYTAVDNADGDLTAQVQVSGSVDTSICGTYPITYTVTDAYGNTATVTRNVVVETAKPPEVIQPGDKVIYLTFDDGPGAYTEELLDILAKYQVKATFFVCDKGIRNPIMKRIVEEGHAIGVHTQSHVYESIYASEEAFLADFRAMKQIILEQTGVDTKLFRFPGGSSNGVSKEINPGIMTRLAKLMTDMGYQYFDWNVNSNDAGGAKNATTVYNNVIAGIQKHNVSVVLQHDIKKYTVEAMEQILAWGIENGYTFLPLNENSPVCKHQINN